MIEKLQGIIIWSLVIGFIVLFIWTYTHDSNTTQEDCIPNYQGGCDY